MSDYCSFMHYYYSFVWAYVSNNQTESREIHHFSFVDISRHISYAIVNKK